jgi:hypothetical protein
MDYNKTPPQGENDTPEAKEPAVAYGVSAMTEADRLAASVLGKQEEGEEYDIDPDDYPDTTAYLNAIPGCAERLIASLNNPGEFEDWDNAVSDADDDPAFRAAVLRRADEAMAYIAAGGRMYTTEEVFEELDWRIKNDKWDDVEERMRRNGRI